MRTPFLAADTAILAAPATDDVIFVSTIFVLDKVFDLAVGVCSSAIILCATRNDGINTHPMDSSPLKGMLRDKNREWGTHAWHFMHFASFRFPEEPTMAQSAAAARWIKDLAHMLPCPTCAAHWTDYVSSNPPGALNRRTLSRYVFDAHNSVNKRIGKRQISWEAAKRMYAPEYSKRRALKRAVTHVGVVVALVCLIVAGVVFVDRCSCRR